MTKYSSVNHDSAIAKVFINPYAAVPSMHCAFALMIGASGVAVCRHWWAKAWWAFWPILIAWVVIVTANHYWVDGPRLDGRPRLLRDRQRRAGAPKPEAWGWHQSTPRRARPREVEA